MEYIMLLGMINLNGFKNSCWTRTNSFKWRSIPSVKKSKNNYNFTLKKLFQFFLVIEQLGSLLEVKAEFAFWPS